MPPDDQTLSAEEQALLDADRQAGDIGEDGGTGQAAVDPAVVGETGGDADPAGADGQQPQQRQQTVPHAALHEEREAHKATKAALAETKRNQQVLEDRFNVVLQRIGQPQTQPATQGPAIPQFDQDPIGNMRATQAQSNAILAEVVQAVIGRQQQDQAVAGATQLQQRAAAMERDFAVTTPDYDKAATHLFDARRKELVAAGWSDPAEIHQMMVSEANGLAARALQQGRNPAEVVYDLAKLRGYQPPAANDPPALNGAGQPSGEERVATIARGQQQGRGVGALRGTGPAQLTAQSVANMSPSEFDAFLAKASPEQMAEIF